MQKRRRQKSNAQDNQAGQQLGSRAAKSVVSEPNLEASRQRAMLASPRGSILLQMRVKAGQKDRSDIGIWMLGKTRESLRRLVVQPHKFLFLVASGGSNASFAPAGLLGHLSFKSHLQEAGSLMQFGLYHEGKASRVPKNRGLFAYPSPKRHGREAAHLPRREAIVRFAAIMTRLFAFRRPLKCTPKQPPRP